ncbi:DUF4649 family protein [Lactococcus fujiensis]|uniref:DUF4649 domain-containing protein n=1 Tax=Lactococcus fujiensis JCM 16395 TaxID=1291764 RepID=A0A2A5RKT2_9LACT|nr:DUF4649 family protein [Lactococcus fujiensis]PCR99811.1 hypothetical protein RT41_GL001617 [Lactococcus fujiensis JCM 16395]
MMKLTFKQSSGLTYTEEFESPAAFISAQLADYDVIPDEDLVLELIIDDKIVEFVGNVGELYYELS